MNQTGIDPEDLGPGDGKGQAQALEPPAGQSGIPRGLLPSRSTSDLLDQGRKPGFLHGLVRATVFLQQPVVRERTCGSDPARGRGKHVTET